MSLIRKLKKTKHPVRYLSREAVFRGLSLISRRAATEYLHRNVTGKALELRNPVEFNDKLQWLKLYWRDPLMTLCADKYAVREYVREKCGAALLNELYGVYESPDEIAWDGLPDRFVLKCTHGCGYNIICLDKGALDKAAAIKKLRGWMRKKYGKYQGETHYNGIRPKIICERYLGSETGELPADFKIYCFNGRPELILTVADRSTAVRYAMYDPDWRGVDVFNEDVLPNDRTQRPDCFEALLEHAAALSEPFPFVRADFYVDDGKPLFGELTFTPAAGMWSHYSEYGSKLLGGMLTLPDRR